jgi:hypothetical protein
MIGAYWWSAPDFAAQTRTTGAFGDLPARRANDDISGARTRTAGQLGLGLARLTSQGCLPELSELVMCPGSTEPGAHKPPDTPR